jgi:DNA-directed RNA polymerase specialized sigma24 family protein
MQRHLRIASVSEHYEPSMADVNNVEANELRQTIKRAFPELPAHEREALMARARVSGELCRDVAARYRVCPQTVYNWADSAKSKMRPHFKDWL